MARAVAHYPFEHSPEAALTAMTANETQAVILHELGEAYRRRAESGDLGILRQAAAEGLARWGRTARELIALHERLGDAVGAEIEARLAPKQVH